MLPFFAVDGGEAFDHTAIRTIAADAVVRLLEPVERDEEGRPLFPDYLFGVLLEMGTVRIDAHGESRVLHVIDEGKELGIEEGLPSPEIDDRSFAFDLVYKPFVDLEREYLLGLFCGERSLEHSFFASLTAHHAMEIAQGRQPEIKKTQFVSPAAIEAMVDLHGLLLRKEGLCQPCSEARIIPEHFGND
jgi:hypothetical protein